MEVIARRRPIEVRAWQFIAGAKPPKWVADAVEDAGDDYSLYVKTLEGEVYAVPGDWIVRGVKGEIYPIAGDIFRETYDIVREVRDGQS